MSGLLRRVQAFADREGLWTPATPVVAAVSGGSDSVALAWVLHELAEAGRLRFAGVAHLHHHLRGADADADAAFVAALAARLGIPLHLGHADVARLARDTRRSVELAGRDARLAFFEQARTALGGEVVAVAHTRGDQAETVLFRLTRGAGPRGLGAMAARHGSRVRPLLEEGRAALQGWLRERGEPWREDVTNADVGPARNRLRHRVLPELARINPRVEAALSRAARIQAEDARWLDHMAEEAAVSVVRADRRGLRLDGPRLAQLPDALARRVILRALETLDPSRAYGWEEAARVRQLPASSRVRVGRVGVERIGGDVVLLNRGRLLPHPETGPPLVVEVPGRVSHPVWGWTLEIGGPMPPGEAPPRTEACAVLDAAALGRHLTIRGWLPGDRVQPLGLGGRKKVHDVFIDRKVPRDERAQVPLVVDEQGRIAWVAGHVVGEAFRVTPHSSGVVVLTLRR